MSTSSRWLDIDQAAEYLGTTKRNMYRLVESRTVAHYRVARRLQFTVKDLDAYLEGQRVEPADPADRW